jgi:hypothetical protein
MQEHPEFGLTVSDLFGRFVDYSCKIYTRKKQKWHVILKKGSVINLDWSISTVNTALAFRAAGGKKSRTYGTL